MQRYYNTELEHVTSYKLKWFLSEHHIKYEASACDNLIHFEIYCTEFQKTMIDNYIDMIEKEGTE